MLIYFGILTKTIGSIQKLNLSPYIYASMWSEVTSNRGEWKLTVTHSCTWAWEFKTFWDSMNYAFVVNFERSFAQMASILKIKLLSRVSVLHLLLRGCCIHCRLQVVPPLLSLLCRHAKLPGARSALMACFSRGLFTVSLNKLSKRGVTCSLC